MDGNLDPTTLTTLRRYSKDLLMNKFILRGLAQERIRLVENEKLVRARIAELLTRINRELTRDSKLRAETEEDGE